MLVLSGFRKAHISEAVAEDANLAHLFENPFQDIDAVDGTSSRTFTLLLYSVLLIS